MPWCLSFKYLYMDTLTRFPIPIHVPNACPNACGIAFGNVPVREMALAIVVVCLLKIANKWPLAHLRATLMTLDNSFVICMASSNQNARHSYSKWKQRMLDKVTNGQKGKWMISKQFWWGKQFESANRINRKSYKAPIMGKFKGQRGKRLSPSPYAQGIQRWTKFLFFNFPLLSFPSLHKVFWNLLCRD